jgi:glycosyltransferase involved in cell wall biosynthesis
LIVILNDHIRGRVSNEETFWSMLEKNLPNSIGISTSEIDIPLEKKLAEINPTLVIQNANLGRISRYKTISFLQDPLVEMERHFEPLIIKLRAKVRGREPYYPSRIKKQLESLETSIKVTNSNYMAHMYEKAGKFKVISMGVDHELFRPLDKNEMRKKYNIPTTKKVNIFVGSRHKIKGFDKIQKMIGENNDTFWILVLKDAKVEPGHNYTTFHGVPQYILAELYNCADKLVARSITESFGLAAVEAMFCDIPVDVTSTGVFWDWYPACKNPRKEAMDYGLDKNTWMKNWVDFVNMCSKEE